MPGYSKKQRKMMGSGLGLTNLSAGACLEVNLPDGATWHQFRPTKRDSQWENGIKSHVAVKISARGRTP